MHIGRAAVFAMEEHNIDAFLFLDPTYRRAVHKGSLAHDEADHAVFQAGYM